MPKGREDWRLGTGVSVMLHVALIVLLLLPLAVTGDFREMAQGAGGPGPAGGGGGGTRGTGALKAELLRFVRIAPPPPPVATPAAVVPPVTPPPPTPLALQPQIETTKLPEPTITVGTGGGTGTDGTTGTGPGSGGGVGSGIGTGRGSGAGPGTGGGSQVNYPPAPIEMFIPPLPVPQSVKGFHLIAEFDIDEKGKVLGMTFAETPDRGYNRRLTDVLRGYRFRPGTQPDGTPIRMKFQLVVDLY
jgi:protein TonB